ncbi:hypothetical protein [Oceanobacillus jeddahense]|uniref:Uncharacterized protein n=1 Tax=Oceanobacillus jeddahense TaxID=1462527 RepID=A0ABY5JXD4_9BACI|nr:hypothetical protein [Oceanobacillus jeddahense]UUI05057.1 hypothetical protein NP439_10635 [Oceanobacillus jeddahense]
MEESISILKWKAFVENKQRKKLLVKLIWNDIDKLTLLLPPNIKVNAFIKDEKEGYLFYDMEGNPISSPIPSIIPSSALKDGQILLKALNDGQVTVYGKKINKKEIQDLY